MNEREVKQSAATIEILLGNILRLEAALNKIIEIGSDRSSMNTSERVDKMLAVAETELNE